MRVAQSASASASNRPCFSNSAKARAESIKEEVMAGRQAGRQQLGGCMAHKAVLATRDCVMRPTRIVIEAGVACLLALGCA